MIEIKPVIGKKKSKTKIILTNIIIGISLIIASLLIILFPKYIGYVSYFAGQAGYIYKFNIIHKTPTDHWGAIYGVAVRVPGYTNLQYETFCPGTLTETNLLFDCMQKDIENEVYASLVPPDQLAWDTLRAATPSEIDAWMNVSTSAIDSATNTFTDVLNIEVGPYEIQAPGTYTYDTSGSRTVFDTIILKDANGNLVIASHTTNFTRGFTDRLYNYQMLLPVPKNECVTYYFSTDPYDTCPEGEGQLPNQGWVIGNVTSTDNTPLSGVIVGVDGSYTTTDEKGFYNVTAPEGFQHVFAVKSGYKVYHNNVTVKANETVVHNIVLEIESENLQGTGTGPGQDEPGTGQGVGPGEAPLMPIIEQPKRIEGTDYVITIAEIKRKLRESEFLQERLSIINYRDSTITAIFEVEGNVTDLVELDHTKLIVPSNDRGDLTITIFGKKKPGVYKGNITITGSINATIPVEIEILPKDKLPVQALFIDLTTLDKKVYPNQYLRFKATLRNLLTDIEYPVQILFTLQNSNGSITYWSRMENINIKTTTSLLRKVKIPKDMKPGEYVLRMTAYYMGFSTSTSALVKVALPFYLATVFWKIKVWHLILFVFILTLATLGFIYYRKYKESKKKYHLKVDLKELPKPGPRSIFVGRIAETSHKAYFDLEQFKTHAIVAGTTGGGKTVAAQVIVEEALKKGVAVIVFDPTAQWSGFLRKQEDKGMLRLYPLFGMNPKEARAFPGNVKMITDPYEVIEIKKYMKPGEIQIFALNKLEPKDIDIVVSNAIRQVFKEGFDESRELRLLIVFDEVHRLLPKFGGSGEGFIQVERGCREFRKWGIGILLVSQVLADFVGQIKANINTEIQMRTRDEGDLQRIATKYGEEVLRSLVKASVGTGMVQNAAYNRGKPYFVTFRPLLHNVTRLSDEELEQYNKYNEIIEDIEWQLQQLEELGQDVFDLKLELKLALDKLKTGNFNMVQVYLDGLTPRLKKIWDKLGKKPKKREKKRVSVEELKRAIEEAKKEREEIEKKEEQEKKEKEEQKPKTAFDVTVEFKNAFNFENGVSLISLQEVIDALPTVPPQIFFMHINKEKNELAEWISKNFSKKLGEELMDKRDKESIVNHLVEAQKKKDSYPYEPLASSVSPSKEDKTTKQQKQEDQSLQPAQQQGEEVKAQGKEEVQETTISNEANTTGNSVGNNKEIEITAPTSSGNVLVMKTKQIDVSAPQGSEFICKDGTKISSLKQLADMLATMNDEVFNFHVGQNYNHFADWIENVFHISELANQIRGKTDKEEIRKIIINYLTKNTQ